MMLTTTQLRAAWGPACKLRDPVTLELHGAGRVHVDGRMADAVRALNDVLVRWDYRTRRADTGAYNCRKITGGNGYSLHAFGIAIDINWQSNPYGKKLVTDMPAGMVAEIKALRTRNGKQVWGWGGDYRTNKDAMHYEAVCAPADLATGIANTSAPSGTGIPHDVLRRGDTGRPVTAVQWTLTFLGHPTTVDGHYGPDTAAQVGAFQRAINSMGGTLTVDGVWGPRTAQYAEFWTWVTLAGKG
jgi:peptidoglycan hydrolase-like protein with peptidoglycan-binding domain